jgi:hypothetical protein
VHGTNGADVITIEIETGKSDITATIAKLAGLTGRRVLFVFDEHTRERLPPHPDCEVWMQADLES